MVHEDPEFPVPQSSSKPKHKPIDYDDSPGLKEAFPDVINVGCDIKDNGKVEQCVVESNGEFYEVDVDRIDMHDGTTLTALPGGYGSYGEPVYSIQHGSHSDKDWDSGYTDVWFNLKFDHMGEEQTCLVGNSRDNQKILVCGNHSKGTPFSATMNLDHDADTDEIRDAGKDPEKYTR